MKSRGPHPVHEGGRCAYPPGRTPCLVGPLMPTDVHLDSIYSLSGRKKFGEKKIQGEGFITFYDTEPPPSPKLSREG